MPFWNPKPTELRPPDNGPDFSSVNTVEKALAMVADGVLEPLLLMPEVFGGTSEPFNTVYVPIGIAEIKESIDNNVIASLVADGLVQHYSASPEYCGRSVVPMALRIEASNPGQFQNEIAIWGEALRREP